MQAMVPSLSQSVFLLVSDYCSGSRSIPVTTRRTNNDCRVTITHNNRCAEMLAHVRRGPFARPTAEERIEHLLTRVRKKSNVAFGAHALEHTLSFQRRVHTIKADVLWRGRPTPLGITQDYWDRTEDRHRHSIKSHIALNHESCRCAAHN